MQKNIADIRKEYSQHSLLEKDVAADAIDQFTAWWNEAMNSAIDEVNAMTLATVSADGIPAARIVLLKDYSKDGFVFFTNYNSSKGKQVAENPNVCLLFFWKELERQVKINGKIEKIAAADSDEYFNSRPEGSRIGAYASPQSSIIENREWLDNNYLQKENELKGKPIARPAHWGGYLVLPSKIEFWQGRPSRLHDRLQYTLLNNGQWKIERLAP